MKLRQFSALQIALALSVLAHVALLAVRFSAPETFNRVFEESPLDTVGDSADEAQQMLLLAQVRDQLAALPRPDPRLAGQPSDQAAQEERHRQLLMPSRFKFTHEGSLQT